MRTAKILMTVLLLGAPIWAEAQAKPAAATGAPEVLSGTAEMKNATGAISGTLEARVTRYSLDFDRTTVEAALKSGGYPRFLTTLRNAPQVGELVLGGGKPYAIRYARERTNAGARTILLVTDRPVYFVGSDRTDAPPRAGYEWRSSRFSWTRPEGAKARWPPPRACKPDGDGGVLLDDYAELPIARDQRHAQTFINANGRAVGRVRQESGSSREASGLTAVGAARLERQSGN